MRTSSNSAKRSTFKTPPICRRSLNRLAIFILATIAVFITLNTLYSRSREIKSKAQVQTEILNGTLLGNSFLRHSPSNYGTNPKSSIAIIVNSSEKEEADNKLKQSKIVLWSSDFHISPVADIKSILSRWYARVIDKSLSGHCHLTDTCATDLRVLSVQNGISLAPCPNDMRRQFYTSYRSDVELMSVDAILCLHAASMCEIFMPFDKPLIVIASTRYEIGRHDKKAWQRWNENLIKIASKGENTIAANNLYDLLYMQYFTDLKRDQILLLPSVCGYITDSYNPSKSKILLAPARGIKPVLTRLLAEALFNFNTRSNYSSKIDISPIRTIYPGRYEYIDIASHPAIVLLPYQVSIMSFFEFYKMGIPIFAPSLELLTDWHLSFGAVSERSWAAVYGHPSSSSAISRHPNSSCPLYSDPNDEFSRDSLLQWLALSDFYQWPHVVLFDSFEHLFEKILLTDLKSVSSQMLKFIGEEEARVHNKWREVLEKVRIKKDSKRTTTVLPENINHALSASYNLSLSQNDCFSQFTEVSDHLELGNKLLHYINNDS